MPAGYRIPVARTGLLSGARQVAILSVHDSFAQRAEVAIRQLRRARGVDEKTRAVIAAQNTHTWNAVRTLRYADVELYACLRRLQGDHCELPIMSASRKFRAFT